MERTPAEHHNYPKLVSLLALASGAVAMPQTSEADIIFTDLSASTPHIGHLFDPTFLINNLPGAARIDFAAHDLPTAVSSTRWVLMEQNAGYVRFKTLTSFAIPNDAGKVWGTIGGNIFRSATIGSANYHTHLPAGFDHKYLAFEFQDTTHGNAMRYGWIQVTLANSTGDEATPEVTIFGYAFDDTGAQVPMGAVPEPSSMALMAMALGAVGVRAWRRKRAAASQV